MNIKSHAVSILPKSSEDKAKKPWGASASIVLTLIIYFASQIIGGMLVLLYPMLRGWDSIRTENWFDTSVFAQFFLILAIEALVVLAVYFLLSFRNLKLKYIGLKKPKRVDVLWALAGFGIYFIIYVLLFVVVKQLFPQIDLEQKQQIGFDTSQQGIDLLIVFMSLVILPPIAEEILVRGFLYTGLRTKLTLWPAALVASGLFAVAHLQFGSGEPLLWAAAIDTFVLSMVLIYIREQRKSLAAPIMIHMMKNGLAFLLLFVIAAK